MRRWKHKITDPTNKRLYRIWGSMYGRCYRSTDRHYKWYGARGITICAEWLKDFDAFADWAYENGYEPGLTIDRLDVDGMYCPTNCQWITQSANTYKRNVDGGTLVRVIDNNTGIIYGSLAEAARATGVPVQTIFNRVKNGWKNWSYYKGGKEDEV